MSYIVCFNCGKPGHLSTECYSRGSSYSKGIICFKCGKHGHLSTECYSRGSSYSSGVICFKCGKTGHYASSCYVRMNESPDEYESDCDSVESDEYDVSSDYEFDSMDSDDSSCIHRKRHGSDMKSVKQHVKRRGYSITYPNIQGNGVGSSNKSEKFKSSDKTSGVYVLQYTNGMMYVGKSRNIQKRVNHHKKGEFALSWGEPKVVPTETNPITDDLESWERNETLHFMRKIGIDKVRGWKYTSLNLTSEERKDASKQIREKYDLCRLCGSDKHFESDCKFKK